MLVMNDRGVQHLLSSKFVLSGEGSAAAGPVGRHASAGTDWKPSTEILTYSRSKGAFAGLTLEGAVIEPDADSTTAIYGGEVATRSILNGQVAVPAGTATEFLNTLNRVTQVQVHFGKEASTRGQLPDC
jgi:lipid-binding SYLF domain-containing protein